MCVDETGGEERGERAKRTKKEPREQRERRPREHAAAMAVFFFYKTQKLGGGEAKPLGWRD